MTSRQREQFDAGRAFCRAGFPRVAPHDEDEWRWWLAGWDAGVKHDKTPDDLVVALRQLCLFEESQHEPSAKFIEGWNLHRRGFPVSALVSTAALDGWRLRQRFHPDVNN